MKLNKYFFVSAVGVIGLAFASCATEEEVEPNVNTEKGVVKTEFQLNIPTQQKATRMSDAVVQYSFDATPALSVFRGIQAIKLIPLNVSTIEATSTRFGDNITLAASTNHIPGRTNANQIEAASLNTGTNSQLYKDVEVQIGTKGFLFYGYAIDAAANGNNVDGVAYTLDEVNGSLTASNLDDKTKAPSTFEFALKARYLSGGSTGKGDAIADYLTSIANTTGWSTSTNVGMQQLYQDFITMKAGSSRSVQEEVQVLYNLLSSGTATDLKTAIISNILGAENANATVSDGKLTLSAALSGYPADIYLPDGAAVIGWDDTDKEFKNLLTSDPTTDWVGANITKPTSYAYPPSLWYRTNSDIICDTKYHESDYTNTSYKWTDVISAYNTSTNKSTEVLYGTRSIALKNDVQYAVGRMDLSVKANAATLKDNRATLIKEDGTYYTDQDITVGETNFQVTGVLIGDQYQKADWQFQPVSTSTPMTVYDNVITSSKYMLSSSMANVNRTLVMESVNEAPVRFAIEFLNNGNDFYGANGWVRKGTKFYLIGKMVPKSGDTGYNVKEGTSTKVFIQDYYTTVEATVNSLKNAYNVVPDLRLPQLELGLSVDLKWQAANTFAVTLE